MRRRSKGFGRADDNSPEQDFDLVDLVDLVGYYANYYPERGDILVEKFDPFEARSSNLTFEKCDTDVFGLLGLAYEAGRERGIMPAVMNSANEASVAAFLEEKIGFLDIERTVKKVYEEFLPRNFRTDSLDDILGFSNEAFRRAGEILNK